MTSKGIFIEADFDVQEGSEIDLSFTAPDNCLSFCNIKGRIVWVNSSKSRPKPSMPVGFGVEFVDINVSEPSFQNYLASIVQLNSSHEEKKPTLEIAS